MVLFFALFATPVAAETVPVETKDLASGRHAHMHMLLEKTVLGVDVVTVDMQFDAKTAERLEAASKGKKYSKEAADEIATAAYRAENAFVRMRFERHVSFDDFVEGSRKSLGFALKAGMITKANYDRSYNGLPQWFGFLKKNGIHKGDRIYYRAKPDSLRTVYVDHQGKTMLDQTDDGADPRLALLAPFFAPGSDFREPLIRSQFE